MPVRREKFHALVSCHCSAAWSPDKPRAGRTVSVLLSLCQLHACSLLFSLWFKFTLFSPQPFPLYSHSSATFHFLAQFFQHVACSLSHISHSVCVSVCLSRTLSRDNGGIQASRYEFCRYGNSKVTRFLFHTDKRRKGRREATLVFSTFTNFAKSLWLLQHRRSHPSVYTSTLWYKPCLTRTCTHIYYRLMKESVSVSLCGWQPRPIYLTADHTNHQHVSHLGNINKLQLLLIAWT